MPRSKDNLQWARQESEEDPLNRLLRAIRTQLIHDRDWQGLLSVERKTERSFEGVSLDDILHDIVIDLWSEREGEWTEAQFDAAVVCGVQRVSRKYKSRQRAASRHAQPHENMDDFEFGDDLYDTAPLSLEEHSVSEEKSVQFFTILIKIIQHDADCMKLLEALYDSQTDVHCPDFEFKDNAKIAAHLGEDLNKIENIKKRYKRYHKKALLEVEND